MNAEARLGIDRPLTIVIAAMGGEGGGLLADWIVAAAKDAGLPVQSTSIPGVAQRTGATTYYLELMKPAAGEAREPVFGLYPAPGHVDIAVASELVEAGRLIENGFVSPDRTTLIASTHRVFAIAEKGAMSDGAFEAPRIVDAARALGRRVVLEDFASLAAAEATALNAILLGAVAGAATLPIGKEAFERAIEARGVAPAQNLKGFRAGYAYASGELELTPAGAAAEAVPPAVTEGSTAALVSRARQALPGEAMDIVVAGVERMVDYQDRDYAALYLDRLQRVHAADAANGGAAEGYDLTRETARYLALWMAYEDVVRVADLKSRGSRFERIRRETGVEPEQPIRITEFLKPGLEEAASILPARWGRVLRAWAERKGIKHRLHIPMHMRTDTIWGFLRLRLLARMKSRRRKGLRFREEQAMIERWLAAVEKAASLDYRLACEIAECGRLIKGYSDTRERANRNFEAIFDKLIEPVLGGKGDLSVVSDLVAAAREAALADDVGKALAEVLAGAGGDRDAGVETTRKAAAAAE